MGHGEEACVVASYSCPRCFTRLRRTNRERARRQSARQGTRKLPWGFDNFAAPIPVITYCQSRHHSPPSPQNQSYHSTRLNPQRSCPSPALQTPATTRPRHDAPIAGSATNGMATQTLHGACACGRNRYVVEIPQDEVDKAELRYDKTAATRTFARWSSRRLTRAHADRDRKATTRLLPSHSGCACPCSGSHRPHSPNMKMRHAPAFAAASSRPLPPTSTEDNSADTAAHSCHPGTSTRAMKPTTFA